MSGRLRRLVRDLAGRNDASFVELLRSPLAMAVDACALLQRAIEPGGDVDVAAEEVAALEEEAGRRRQSLIDELSVVLTTPLDREDLFRLSRALDDVVDNLRDFAEALQRFELPHARPCATSLREIEHGLRELDEAVVSLRGGAVGVPAKARAAKREANVRTAFLTGLTEVLHGEVTAEMLRLRELLRRLDVVGLRFGEACDVLADAALKRS